MTDEKWKDLIERSAKAHIEANRLRGLAEKEYERRYGKNPSEIDDDWWIDTIQGLAQSDVDMTYLKYQAVISSKIIEQR